MTADDFRRLATALRSVDQDSHMGHPDFRVGGKIFATLTADGDRGMVKLTPDMQARYVASAPLSFAPVPGGWGERGATHVKLDEADESIVAEALAVAWAAVAPKKLLKDFDAPR